EVEHAVLPWLRAAVRSQVRVIALQRVGDGARRAARENHDAKAALAQFVCRLDRRLAAFDHVGQQRYTAGESGAGGVHFLRCSQSLDEQRIDTAIEVAFSALERGFQSLDRER